MAKANKFNFLQNINRDVDAEAPAEEESSVVEEPAAPEPDQVPVEKEGAQQKQEIPIATVEFTRRVGRPKGKRSDPDYDQVTAYIRKETHRQVKIALLTEGQGREFSELVEELLGEFLRTQKSG